MCRIEPEHGRSRVYAQWLDKEDDLQAAIGEPWVLGSTAPSLPLASVWESPCVCWESLCSPELNLPGVSSVLVSYTPGCMLFAFANVHIWQACMAPLAMVTVTTGPLICMLPAVAAVCVLLQIPAQSAASTGECLLLL